MSNGFSNQMEQDYYDELFMQDAARLIDTKLLEEAKEAQDFPIDEAWLNGLQAEAEKKIHRKRSQERLRFTLTRIGRIAATFVIIASLLFSGVYLSVDAAREAINNFMTGKTNRRATVVYPVPVEGKTYSLIPEGWRGPLYATWLPDGFHHANSGTQLDRYWWLCYTHEDSFLKTVCIYAWDETYKPTIDVEGYELIGEQVIQDVPAAIYYDQSREYHMLIMVKNDLTIQIVGDVSFSEVVQIAEFLEF